MQEVAAVCAIAATHLSRMAAELVLWSSAEFAFVRLADAHATGSSIMPQKRNPDAAELVRGKTGRVYGDLMSLLTLTKGLPMSYHRDLQEDRRPLFDAVTTTLDSVELMIEIWNGLEFTAERFTAELAGDASLATELADALVETGRPFRQAHGAVARLMAELETAERTIDTLTDAELEALGLEPRHRALLDPRAAAERRTSMGGTSWAEIERQLGCFASHGRAAGTGLHGPSGVALEKFLCYSPRRCQQHIQALSGPRSPLRSALPAPREVPRRSLRAMRCALRTRKESCHR
jgi:argininosuccinate lyase